MKVSTFPPLVQKLGRRILPYFARSIIGMTPKKPESFVTVSRTVSEIFGILLSDTIAYLQKDTTRTESVRYSFTVCRTG